MRDVDLEINPGEIVALLGANGSGKTTTMLAMAGVLPVFVGTVAWKGAPLTGPLHRRVKQGLCLVPHTAAFSRLSVRDNLRLGLGPIERALELFPELKPMLKRRAGLLSGGEQQMLCLARSLSGDPAVVMVDELSAGLSPIVTQRLFESLREASGRGAAILLVEQQVQRALSLSDRAYILRSGTVALQGSSADLLARLPEVEAQYLAGVEV